MTKATLEWENFTLTLESKNDDITLDESEKETLIIMLEAALIGLGYHAKTAKITD